MICPNCNAQVSDSQAFCGNCGVPLAQAQAEPAGTTDATAPASHESGYQQPADAATAPIGGDTAQMPYGNPADQTPYANAQPYGNPQSPYGAAPSAPYGTPSGSQGATGQPYGQAPIPPGGYAPQPQEQASSVPFGLSIAALVCSLIGLFPIGIILAIIAIVMNSKQKREGVVTTRQTPTFVMSIISLVVSIAMAIVIALFGAVLVAAIENGSFDGLNVTTNSSGSSVTITTPSGTSINLNSDGSVSTSSASSGSASAVSSSSAATNGTLSSGAAALSFNPVGTWEINSMEGTSADSNLSAEDLNTMRELGMNVLLIINEDGTATLDVFGESLTGTWKSSGSNSITVTIDNSPITATLEGDLLVLADGSDKLKFQRQS